MGLRSGIGWLWVAELLALPSVAAAQEQAIGRPYASVLTVSTSPSLLRTGSAGPATIFQRATSVGQRSNYWLEGAIAGGVLLAATGMFLANGLCDADSGTDNCTSAVLLAGLSTGTAGAVIGAFVGKTIKKGGDGTPP